MSDQDRIERERAFHDERFTSDHERAAVEKYYDSSAVSIGRYHEYVDALPEAFHVLELGCGLNGAALDLARRGVRVTAIDISPVAVEALALAADAEPETGGRLDARVANAEALDMPDQSFDAVVGTGILHHLDLDAAYAEICRVLKSSGVGVFYEPLGANPIINAYRSLTPAMRTVDEHPLVESDFDQARGWFDFVAVEYFHTLSLAAVPLRSRPEFAQILLRLDRLDQWMYRRVPPSRALAWTCVLRLAGPRPEHMRPLRRG